MLKAAIEKILDIATPAILEREDGTFAVSADKVMQICPRPSSSPAWTRWSSWSAPRPRKRKALSTSPSPAT